MSKAKPKPLPPKQEQIPLFEAQTAWFHVFKSMIDSGDVKKLGPYATTVYLVIKAYTNWKTGRSWPGIERIVDDTGISKRKVMDCLDSLVENGYLVKEKIGRKNTYRLREKIPFLHEDENGELQTSAVATWDYLPSTVKEAVAELRNFQVTGSDSNLQIVHIEQLTINLQQNFDRASGNLNVLNSPIDWEAVPDTDPVKRAYLASKRAKTNHNDGLSE